MKTIPEEIKDLEAEANDLRVELERKMNTFLGKVSGYQKLGIKIKNDDIKYIRKAWRNLTWYYDDSYGGY